MQEKVENLKIWQRASKIRPWGVYALTHWGQFLPKQVLSKKSMCSVISLFFLIFPKVKNARKSGKSENLATNVHRK